MSKAFQQRCGEWTSVQVVRILERLDPFGVAEAASALRIRWPQQTAFKFASRFKRRTSHSTMTAASTLCSPENLPVRRTLIPALAARDASSRPADARFGARPLP
jgi:hypothetical protein